MYSHKRVLVALDGSTAGEAVLRFLMEIAGPLEMTVMLLHVLEPLTPQVVEGTVVLDDFEARRREAEEYLAPISAALRSQGVDTAWSIVAAGPRRRSSPPRERAGPISLPWPRTAAPAWDASCSARWPRRFCATPRCRSS